MSFRVASAAVMLSLVTVVVCARGQNASSDWQPARPAYAWSFPRDHAAHPGYRNEWWYFVGHLEDDAGRRYGYQLTLFRIGIAPAPPGWNSSWDASDIAMGHLAITEIDADPGRHTFAEAVHRATRALGGFGTGVGAGVGDGDTLAWCQAPAGSRGRWTVRLAPPTGDSLGTAFDLDARDDRSGLALSLHLEPTRPPLLQGEGGFSRKSANGDPASLYYSLTRLRTAGSIRTPTGRTLPVTGRSWMDHEFSSNQLGSHQVGWDWFALQLDDGRDLMLYLLRDGSGVDYARGTVREADGTVSSLLPEDWDLRALDRWTVYPSGWQLSVTRLGIAVEIRPLLESQENVSELVPGLRYWEGAVEVRDRTGSVPGAIAGTGYVELTGYGPAGRLPF